MPPRDPSLRDQAYLLIGGALCLVVFLSGALLARRNVRQGKSDSRSAFRLAVAIFWLQMALWVFRAHFTASVGTLGILIVALCTSIFFAVLLWTVYVALEPYVRRHWPQALISWTGVLTGRLRDPIVGRDVLFGIGVGVVGLLLDRCTDVVGQAQGLIPNFGDLDNLMGFRGALGAWIGHVPVAIRATLIFFFVLFLLKVLVRNQWIAGAAFVLIWASQTYFQSRSTAAVNQTIEAVLFDTLIAVVIVRLGLLSLTVGVFMFNMLDGIEISFNPSAWYFAPGIIAELGFIAIAIWAFYTATSGRSECGSPICSG